MGDSDLLCAALACIRTGISIIPIDSTTKRPAMRLLPKGSNGRATWKPYQSAIPDEATVRQWFKADIKSFAVVGGKVSGGLLVLDFDAPGFYERWVEAVGDTASGMPIQQTGGGGYQVFVRCPELGVNAKLAWVPDEQEKAGRSIAIETKGEGGYAVVAPSLHPSGNRYRWVGALTAAGVPTVTQERAEKLLAVARALDEAPLTWQGIERVEATARKAHGQRRAGGNGQASVIDAFNAARSIDALLEQHHYSKGPSGRFIRPGGKSESVSVKDGRACHWSSNDPLNDGKGKGGCGCHDAFDVYKHFEHGGNEGKAVRAAAELLGMSRPPSMATKATADGWLPDRLTQQVNAQRLVVALDGTARFNVDRAAWMVYRATEGRLVPDDTGAVNRAAKKVGEQTWAFVPNPPVGIDQRTAFRHAMDSEKAAGISAMMKLAETEPGIPIVAADLDRDGYLLNCANGAVDYRTGTLRSHSPTSLFSKFAPVAFDPLAKCPAWDKFMHRVMDGNTGMIGYLQRIAGLCGTGDVSLQELFIFYGGGANGKSVFIETLIGMYGDYAGIAPESLLTARTHGQEHPTEIADLCGRRLVAASETEEGAKLRVQLVKRLTGDAIMKARFMRQDYFEFPRTHKLMLVTNNRPCIRETTDAVWRRVRLIPFTVTIPPEDRDPNLLTKLKAEWPGILNWCIAGYLDFQVNGMQTPGEVTIATQEYQAEQDPLADYVAERCITRPQARVSRTELFADYATWAKAIGDANPDRNSFYDRVRRIPGVADAMKRVNDHPTRVFTGIGLAGLGTPFDTGQLGRQGVTA